MANPPRDAPTLHRRRAGAIRHATGASSARAPVSGDARIRLGPGEYVDPSGAIPTIVARQLFLEALAEVEPAAVAELADEPLILAVSVRPLMGSPGDEMALLESFRRLTQEPPPEKEDDLVWLVLHTRQWAERWTLSAAEHGWAHLSAMWSVFAWADTLLRGEKPDIALRYPGAETTVAPRLPTEPLPEEVRLAEGSSPLSFAPTFWNPHAETRAAATGRILAGLTRQMHGQLDKIEAAARDLGAKPTPSKRTGGEHFRWLVRYQVKGESLTEIARDACKEKQTVAEAVHGTAALIGLPLRAPHPAGRRRARPGRPRVVRVKPRDP